MRRLPLLAALALAAPASAQEPVPPPSRMPGPMRVCFIDTGLALHAGETAWLDYLGIHSAAIRVAGRHGQYRVREGNSWAVPPEPGRTVPDARGRRIVLYGRPGAFRYLIYGPVTQSGPGDDPSVWIEGAALDGTARDRLILDRITPRASARCPRRFIYGMFFDPPER